MKVLAISAHAHNWTRVYKAVNTLLDYGVVVLWNKEEAVVSSSKLPPGSMILPRDDVFTGTVSEETFEAVAPLSEEIIEAYLKSESITVTKGELLEPISVYFLTPSRVAVYADSGGYNHASVLAASGFDVEFIDGRAVAAGALERFDVFMSGGGGRWRKTGIERENVLLTGLGEEGAMKVSSFVKSGGAYFGCCGGSYIATVVRERFMNWWHPAKRHMTMMNVEDWHIDEFSDSGFKSPGMGTFLANNAAPKNPAMFGMPETFECTHYNGPIFNLIESAVAQASSATGLVVCEGVSPEKFTPSEFFFESDDATPRTLEETGFYKACKDHKVVIAQGFFGLGLVVLSGSHPEISPPWADVHADLWDSARIVCNIAFWSAARNNKSRRTLVQNVIPPYFKIPIGPQKDAAMPSIRSIEQTAEALKTKSLTPLPTWLTAGSAARSFGLTLKAMWTGTLDHMPLVCEELISQLEAMDRLTQKLLSAREELSREIAGQIDEQTKRILRSMRTRPLNIIFEYYHALAYERPSEWDQAGYQGVYHLLQMADSRCKVALENFEVTLQRDAEDNPYSNLTRTMSYLTSTLKILRVHRAAMEKFLTSWSLFEESNSKKSESVSVMK